MNCPNCKSDRVMFLVKDVTDINNVKYSHECLHCGTFISRKEASENYKVGKEVLME